MRLISGNEYNRKPEKIGRKKREEGGGGSGKWVFISGKKWEDRGQHVPSIYAM